MKKPIVPLVIEDHPVNYTGLPYITLIKYRDVDTLVIINNSDEKTINGYVLDLCAPAGIDQETILMVAQRWWEEKRNVPLSFVFSALRMTREANKILRTFNIEYVTRVIGPLPKFPMSEVMSVKRRKRKPIQATLPVTKVVHVFGNNKISGDYVETSAD